MLSRTARAYIGLVTTAGAVVLFTSLWDWHTQDWARYLSYCAIALLASGMKVTLPAVTGTMSMNFLFVLIGIAELGRAETIAMGCLGMLVQCVFHTRKRPKPVQVLFSIASMACSIVASYEVYHIRLLDERAIERPVLLMLSAATFFVTNTFSIALVIALTESKNAWAVWRDSYFWSFPNYLVGAAVGWAISVASRSFGWQTSLLLLPVLYVIYRSHSLYVGRLENEKKRAEEQRNHAEELAALNWRTVQALALAIEAKDQTTHDHLARVELYAVEVGKDLQLSPGDLEALRVAALLHDVGKLAVPDHIISKPGKLTPEEFEKMKVHPVVGSEILESVRFPYGVAPVVRAHHEKWDGSGYPDGLSGEQIPVGARILAAVDCLDALASDRQYRRALPLDEAIKVLQSEAGTAFDPKVVEILARRYVELEQIAKSAGQAEKEATRLSTDLKVERGAAPATGFETAGRGPTAQSDLVNFHRSITEGGAPVPGLPELAEKIERCADREAVFALLREGVQDLVPYDLMVVYRRSGERLLPECVDGDDFRPFASDPIPVGTGLSGWVAESRKPIINGNPSVEPGYLADPVKFSTLRSAMAVPIETQNRLTGVLSLYRRESDAFTTEQLNRIVFVGAKLAGPLDAVPKDAHMDRDSLPRR